MWGGSLAHNGLTGCGRDSEIKEMVRKCTHGYTTTQGRFKTLHAEDIEKIYNMAR